jgi:AAA+ superfamily predicted ATPase
MRNRKDVLADLIHLKGNLPDLQNELLQYPLLQRIEDYPGVVILATNLRSNMDEAFARRFQSIIHFTMPSVEERARLWKDAFSGTCKFPADADILEIAANYELTGGAIINILRTCALRAISRGDTSPTKVELFAAIQKELARSGVVPTILYRLDN